MKRLLFLLLLIAPSAFSQNTTVSGTITDAGGQTWTNGSFQIQFFPGNNQPPFFFNGAPFNSATRFNGVMDGSGHFTQVVPDNNFITPANTQWTFTVCPNANSQCFSTTLKVSGASQNVTSSIIPPAIVVQGNSYNQPTAYADSEIAGPTWGFIYYNTSSNQLRQCNGPLPCTWTAVTGGGAGNPSPPNLSFQYDNAGVFGGSSLLSTDAGQTTVTDSGILAVLGVLDANGGINSSSGIVQLIGDLDACGPNPWIDIRCFGARTVTVSTTGTCTAGNTTLPVTGGSSFINGDGITAKQCGATNTMSTPSAPTVTPSLNQGPTGTGYTVASGTAASNYQYQVSAIDKGSGVTTASAVTAISNGQATLGQQTATITTWTRSNNVTTYNTSASTPIVTGAEICLTGTGTGGDLGCMLVASTPTGTQFTVQTGQDTRSGAAASGSGGTVNYYLLNHLVISNVIGAFSYCWYGRTSGSMAFIGESKPGELLFDDYGATFSAPPASSLCPASPPGSATNDNFTTTIVSGAPGNTLVLAAAPINSSVGTTSIIYDPAPSILTAATAAAQGGGGGAPGVLYIPCVGNGVGFTINSYLDLSALNRLSVFQLGGITLNGTMAVGGYLNWKGIPGCSAGTTSFSKGITATITVGSAFPGILETGSTNSQTVVFEGIQLTVPNQGLGFVASSASGFFTTFGDPFNCSVGSGGNNYTGMCIVTYGNAQYRASNFNLETSTPAGLYSTLTPGIYARNDIGNTVPPAAWTFDNFMSAHQGFAAIANPAIGGAQFYTLRTCYSQGMIMPNFTFEMGNEAAIVHDIGCVPDTTSAPVFTNLGTVNLTADFQAVAAASVVETSGSPMFIHMEASNWGPGQSGGFSQEGSGTIAGQAPWNTRNLTTYPFYNFNEQVLFSGGHSAYIPLAAPSGASVALSAGGSVPIGAQNYAVAGVSIDGGFSAPSAVQVCTTVGGGSPQQTCTLTWSASPGSVSYYPTRNGVAITACEATTALFCVDSTGAVDGSVRPGGTAGGGSTSMTPAGLFSSQIVLASPLGGGNVSFAGTDVPLSLTANRTWNDPDASGQRCVTGLVGCDAFIDTGVANAYVACSTPAITTIPDGFQVTVQIANSSTGPSTLNFCSTGAKTIKKNGGTGVLVGADLAANDLKAGGWYTFSFDTTNWQVMSQLGNVSGGGTVGITGSPSNGNLTAWSSGTTITNTNLTGDVTTSNTSATTVASIKGTPVNCTTAAVGQLLTVITGPQYQCIYPGVNYNAQTADYTLVCPTPDRLGYVDFVGTDTLTHTFTLPQAGSTACLQSSVSFIVSNHSNRSEPTTPVTLTLKATTSSIDGIAGATGIPLTAGESRLIYSDAVSGTGNYHTVEVPASDGGINLQTGSYTATLSDWNKTVLMNCTAACTFTVPNPPPVGKWKTNVMSIGTTLATVSLNTLNFNGTASIPVLNSFQAQEFRTDGSNYFGSAPLVASTNVTFTPSSNGLAISSSGGGGGGVTIQTNGVNNTTQTTLNFQTTSGVSGITATNPSAGNEQFAIANVQGTDAKVLSATSVGTTAYPLTADANAGASSLSLVATTLTDGATVTWAIGSVFEANASLTFTVHSGSRTLNITNPLNGGTYLLKLVQDATGGEGLTLGTGCTWKVINGGGGAVTLSTGANAQDLLTFYFDGTNCYANLGKNYN